MDISCSSESGISKKKKRGEGFSTLKYSNKTKMAFFAGKGAVFFQQFDNTGSVETV